MEFTFQDRLPGDDLIFTVTVGSGPAPAGPVQDLQLSLLGSRSDGTVVIDGKLAFPVEALAAAKQVLWQSIGGLEQLSGRCISGLPGGAIGAAKARTAGAVNAGRPWTAEVKQQLRQAWLAEADTTPADDVITNLAKALGRTRYAIRSQLPRVDCDPDVPGRAMPGATTPAAG